MLPLATSDFRLNNSRCPHWGQRKIVSLGFCHLEGARPAAIGQAWHCGQATSKRSDLATGRLLSIWALPSNATEYEGRCSGPTPLRIPPLPAARASAVRLSTPQICWHPCASGGRALPRTQPPISISCSPAAVTMESPLTWRGAAATGRDKSLHESRKAAGAGSTVISHDTRSRSRSSIGLRMRVSFAWPL